MAQNADQIITKINNIKNNKNNNNTSIVSNENNEVENTTSSFRLAEPVEPLGEALASSGTLPQNWRGVKLDLFANPNHTLKITITRHDGTHFACSSQLNSPRTHVFRGRERGEGSLRHWQLVEYLMELRDDYDYKISKVSQMRKGSTLRDFVALIYHTDNVWHTDLIYEHRIWSFPLTGVVSKAFADKNGIATGFRGITTYHRPWTDPKELGI